MKKHILFLFAAALALVGCSNEDLTGEQPAKGKQVTLSATVDMGVDVTTRATTDNITASTVNFKWEDGDKVVLVDATNQNSSVFTVIGNSINGASAKFTGMALDNMEGYKAVYVGWGDDDDLKALATKIVKGEAVTLPYTYTDYNFVFTNTKADGTLQGSETAFTLYGNNPHIRVQLVGNAKLGKVCYSLGTEAITNAKTAIDFGTNGLQLSKTTAKELIIPAFSTSASGFTLYFCDTDGDVIKTKSANIDLAANKGKIVNFGEMEVKAADPNLRKRGFSVSATKKVKFTRGNLYWDGNDYKFEANQYDYPTSWDANHVGHFYWSKTASVAYAQKYEDSQSTSDKFFCGEDNKITVEGTEGLYALSSAEWTYLLNTRTVNGGTGEGKSWKKGVTVAEKTNCLIIAPDDFSGTIESSYDATGWATAEAAGLVCLPAAGFRTGSNIVIPGLIGYYWSSSPVADNAGDAYNLNDVDPARTSGRGSGFSLRLVKTVE